jgi:hypothetical protein
VAFVMHQNLKPWAAITGPRRAILHPDLERRSDEDPDKRSVLAKCVHALRAWIPNVSPEHNPDARYHDHDAEAYARRALISAQLLRANADLHDEQLAECFRVPVQKIADRRAELGAEQGRRRPGRLCAELDEPGPVRHVAGTPAKQHRRRRRRRVARR